MQWANLYDMVYQSMIYNRDDRNSSMSLFPLKGAYAYTSFDDRPIQVWASPIQVCGDDTLTIDTTQWCYTIEEIQN